MCIVDTLNSAGKPSFGAPRAPLSQNTSHRSVSHVSLRVTILSGDCIQREPRPLTQDHRHGLPGQINYIHSAADAFAIFTAAIQTWKQQPEPAPAGGQQANNSTANS